MRSSAGANARVARLSARHRPCAVGRPGTASARPARSIFMRRRTGRPLRPSSISFADAASRSAHSQVTGTPRGCRPACRNGRGVGGSDSARQMCAPRPTATGSIQTHVPCGAWPARAQCDESGDRAESLPRRTAIPEHTVRPPPRSPAFAVQGWDRIYQGQGLLRVVPVRARQTHGEGHAAPVADQMTLAPALRSVGGIGSSQIATIYRAHEQLSTTARDQSI